MAKPTIVVEIDWSNDGDFIDANEDITADVLSLRYSRGRSSILGAAAIGSLELVLKNDDEKYSPENSAGAIFGNLKPRRQVRLRTTAPVSTTQFTGRIDDIRDEPALLTRKVRINCLDDSAFRLGGDQEVHTRLTGAVAGDLEPDAGGQGPFTGEGIEAVLDEVGWGGGGDRSVDTGVTEMDTYWAGGSSGRQAISALVAEEVGYAYVNGAGAFVFEGRDHRYESDHVTSQATYSDRPGDALRYHTFKPYTVSVERVFNRIQAQARPRKSGSDKALWTLGETVELAPGEARAFDATWDNPASTSVSSTHTANTKSDGSGADITADVGKAEATAKSTFWRITLTNNGTVPAFITALSVTLAPRIPSDESSEIQVEDAASQADYGIQKFRSRPRYIGKTIQAKQWAGYVMGAFGEPVPIITLSFLAYDTAMLTELLNRSLSDRVTVISDRMGLDSDFFVERISHEWSTPHKLWGTTLTLSKIIDEQHFWILANATHGKLGTTTRLFG